MVRPVRRCGSDEETQRAGEEFVHLVRAGDVVILNGPLGAGKTTFVKGLARGLGVRERVVSPTFTMVRDYATDGRGGITHLHHADVYRASGPGDILDLDLHEWREESALVVVEWGERAADLFGEVNLTVNFTPDDSTEARDLEVVGPESLARSGEIAHWEGR
ncbi:MAG: tRNA (adenosine(37)-N6)-threonylcarbamoyltransferase complex ATPase subunit type 1 TsaE [Acidimicrobiaceae bacterium]|nr:tRNA (adenosine(37)-N6)-threonylcarbamoyltransferase complex ATPase subunit type 1 TsaE [Acidimicrobiaceae bacterium]